MIDVKTFTGAEVAPHLDAVAGLRIAVFHDWPYLYAGDREYEKKYLATYAQSPESLFVLAFDGDRVIGASTAIPLTDETAGVDDDERLAFDETAYAVVTIARHAGQIGDERIARARQHVEQRRLADVGAPDEGDYGEHGESRLLDRRRRRRFAPSPACGRGLG